MELTGKESLKAPILNLPKVLIVDDSESMRDLLRAAMTQWGYEVIEAKDGEQAWAIMQRPDAPCLLILDWLMPKLNGIRVCERIRQQLGDDPYIIFLTGVMGAEDIIKGLDVGADEFLLKPVNFVELRARVFASRKVIEYRQIIKTQAKQLKDCTSVIENLLQCFVLLSMRNK